MYVHHIAKIDKPDGLVELTGPCTGPRDHAYSVMVAIGMAIGALLTITGYSLLLLGEPALSLLVMAGAVNVLALTLKAEMEK